MEKLEKQIQDIERNLKISHFHWADFGSRRGWQVRKKFIEKISKLDFNFKIAIIKNPIRLSKTLEQCLRHLVVEKRISKIVIDGKKPKWYSRQLKKVLRDKGVSVKKIRTMRDEASAGLRLADALAGLARSYYDKPTRDVKKLYEMLENKITAQLVGGQIVQ